MLPQQHSFLRGILEWVVTFALVFAFFIFIRMFVIEPYRVPTGSMEPTIEVGDQIFAQKLTVNLGMDVQPGDIVVFRNPDGTSEHDVLVKRVIATAGQTVDLVDGVVYVDGVALDEPYAEGESYPLAAQAEGVSVGFPYTVPEGCVWVMGDNRENSADSRYFGAVPEDDLIGVVVFRYWPLNRFGLV
ncbi:signal peptidase I [uncultured Enorma sp.]|uniref:signal peptidase I n=1 Tax=uncultured Enorma sp. TaxID=1714346 RepID=UPI002597DDA2|nr:signal peptidase I [uncultured Enorma sp.]